MNIALASDYKAKASNRVKVEESLAWLVIGVFTFLHTHTHTHLVFDYLCTGRAT